MQSRSDPKIDFSSVFLEMLTDSDLPPEKIIAALADFDTSQIADAWTRANRYGLILLKAASLTHDPTFSLRLGRQIKLTQFGALGFAVMSCDTLREALALLVRYHPVLDLGPQWQLRRSTKETTLTMMTPALPPDVLRALSEATFSALATVGQELLGKPIRGITLHLSYSEPAHAMAYNAYFYGLARFDHPVCEIVLPNYLLDQSIRTANPAGHVIFRQQCEAMLQSLNRVENVSASVRRLVMQSGRAGQDIKQVAKQLAFSERTLRRRLRVEGTSFREICDEVRNVLAQNYLSGTKLTVLDIAELLNYTEPASFRRAFKRMNGMTPQAFRRA